MRKEGRKRGGDGPSVRNCLRREGGDKQRFRFFLSYKTGAGKRSSKSGEGEKKEKKRRAVRVSDLRRGGEEREERLPLYNPSKKKN